MILETSMAWHSSKVARPWPVVPQIISMAARLPPAGRALSGAALQTLLNRLDFSPDPADNSG
jgi:hypothetical protein